MILNDLCILSSVRASYVNPASVNPNYVIVYDVIKKTTHLYIYMEYTRKRLTPW